MQNSNVIGHPYILQDLPLFSFFCRLEQLEDFVAVNSENNMIKVHLLAVGSEETVFPFPSSLDLFNLRPKVDLTSGKTVCHALDKLTGGYIHTSPRY